MPVRAVDDKPSDTLVVVSGEGFWTGSSTLPHLHHTKLRQVGRRPNAPVSFAHDPDWVQNPTFFLIDPSHQPYGGEQIPPDGGLAGIFTDTSPDRWGRMLLERREAEQAAAARPHALRLLHPFALAIAEAYADTAITAGHEAVHEMRFPFAGVPLVSASAQLASGCLALGIHPKLTGSLVDWIESQQHADGGFGDGDGPSDIMTTLVAAGLLARLDPDWDVSAAATYLTSCQDDRGLWRGYEPEIVWITFEVYRFLEVAGAVEIFLSRAFDRHPFDPTYSPEPMRPEDRARLLKTLVDASLAVVAQDVIDDRTFDQLVGPCSQLVR